MSDKNNTIVYRVGQLEKRQEAMEAKIDSILANHLPHITNQITALDSKIKTMTAINVGGIVLGVIAGKLL